ncbi:hypothetical protein [Nonomuraea dietziae]|uniref:hypothetical protein n=1 Tax=Nonomuraea dietziae TaxID=65515 RepID=UPI0033EC4475
MRIAVATDSLDGVAARIVGELRERGHEVVTHGAWFAGTASTDPADVANVEHLET